jgi:hypothetical protein
MRHFILPRPVAARSRRVFNPATMARLVAPPRCMQRPPARVWRTVGAVDMAPVAIAADDRLGRTAWVRAQKQPGLRQKIVVAPAAPVMRPPMAWTRAVATAMMPLQSCPLHGVGHGAEAKLPGDGSAPCLPSQSRQVYPITLKYSETKPSAGVPSRVAQVGPQEPPAPSLRCAPRALRFGAGPSYGLPGQSGAPS